MSDCTNGGRRAYNAPTHSPDEDRLETVLHFVGDSFPRVFVINRLGREVDYVEVDGEMFERVMECQNIEADSQGRFECSACGYEDWDTYTGHGIAFCPGCGAKVKVGE